MINDGQSGEMPDRRRQRMSLINRLFGQVEKNIPRPFGSRRAWSPGANIAISEYDINIEWWESYSFTAKTWIIQASTAGSIPTTLFCKDRLRQR